jgi:hypothetical protein
MECLGAIGILNTSLWGYARSNRFRFTCKLIVFTLFVGPSLDDKIKKLLLEGIC